MNKEEFEQLQKYQEPALPNNIQVVFFHTKDKQVIRITRAGNIPYPFSRPELTVFIAPKKQKYEKIADVFLFDAAAGQISLALSPAPSPLHPINTLFIVLSQATNHTRRRRPQLSCGACCGAESGGGHPAA